VRFFLSSLDCVKGVCEPLLFSSSLVAFPLFDGRRPLSLPSFSGVIRCVCCTTNPVPSNNPWNSSSISRLQTAPSSRFPSFPGSFFHFFPLTCPDAPVSYSANKTHHSGKFSPSYSFSTLELPRSTRFSGFIVVITLFPPTSCPRA